MKKSVKIAVTAAVLGGVIATAAVAYGVLSKGNKSKASDISASDGQKMAADFTVLDEKKEKVNLSDFFGKPTVINFWASWCPPCVAELPEFNSIYTKDGDVVNFLMVNMTDGVRETRDGTDAFIEAHNYSFPVYYDEMGSAADAYKIINLPTTVFVDADGKVMQTHVGAMSKETLEDYIKELRIGE